MGMKEIRERYAVPAKRGARVRWHGRKGYVASAVRGFHRLNVQTDGVLGGVRIRGVHPFDLDWQIKGKWVSGETLKQKYDERWRQFNQRLKGAA